jgi:hypothetical protein
MHTQAWPVEQEKQQAPGGPLRRADEANLACCQRPDKPPMGSNVDTAKPSARERRAQKAPVNSLDGSVDIFPAAETQPGARHHPFHAALTC